MRLTIIPSDRLVLVDGAAMQFNFEIDPYIRAVQWDGDKGEIEYDNGQPPREITDIEQFKPILTLYVTKAKEAVEQERTEKDKVEKERVDREAFEQTYVYKRHKAYPKKWEQLDMLWHAMDQGEIVIASKFYDAIRKIKDRYPKPKPGETEKVEPNKGEVK